LSASFSYAAWKSWGLAKTGFLVHAEGMKEAESPFAFIFRRRGGSGGMELALCFL
jgi:hypothetical protein